jgi:hypothetical protein
MNMKSTNEKGHAKNVANFEYLISFCTGSETANNPTKNSIKIAAMNIFHTSAHNTRLSGICNAALNIAEFVILHNLNTKKN